MARRMTVILHLTSQLLPVLVDILNYQVALSSSLSGSHYRKYSRPTSFSSIQQRGVIYGKEDDNNYYITCYKTTTSSSS